MRLDSIGEVRMDYLIGKLIMLPGMIIGLTVHEYAHAKVACQMGDPTAERQGRVSLNPLAHIDWIGFLCLIVAGFGWGKPVPVNSNYFQGRHRKLKQVAVSAAGVISNFILATLAAVLMVFLIQKLPQFSGGILYQMLYGCILINVALMVFNLIPLPPLDGFTIVAELTGFDETPMYFKLLQYGSLLLLLLVFTNVISYFLTPGVDAVIHVINMIIGLIF